MINDVWLKVFDQKFSRTCSLPWRKRHQVWPWWQRRLERGGWCWNMCYFCHSKWYSVAGILCRCSVQFISWFSGSLISEIDIKCFTYSPVITTSGDWTQIFAIFIFLEFKILIDCFSGPDYIAGFWWSSICWFTRINHGFITFNRGSIADLVLLSPDCKINQS